MRSELQAAVAQAFAALGVITHDPKIRSWMLTVDPKALQQCDKAFQDLESEMSIEEVG